MNNNMPNNNSNNGNIDLGAVSLGSIDAGNVNNIPPVPPIESIDNQTNVDQANVSNPSSNVNESINNPVPVADSVATLGNDVSAVSPENVTPVNPIPPVSPVSYDVPEAITNFNTTPIFNEIGTVPPISDIPVQTPIMNTEGPKPKKKTNKLIFVIIIVLLITAVGVGVYIFLHMSKKAETPSVVTKNVEIEAGSEISTNIEDYATFKGINSSSCTLDTSNITDTSVFGNEYTFSIKCGNSTYDGKATIVDTVAPSAVSKDVTVQVNGEIKPEDFVSSCNDATECAYAFSDANEVSKYVASAGEYSVDIIVTDKAGNTSTISAMLTVTLDDVPDLYLSCSLNSETYKLGITASNFTGKAKRIYTFKFNSADEYNSFKSQNSDKESLTYENVTGIPSFDDDALTLTLTQDLTKAQLDQEEGTTLPNTYGELRQYYNNQGYTCTIEQP